MAYDVTSGSDVSSVYSSYPENSESGSPVSPQALVDAYTRDGVVDTSGLGAALAERAMADPAQSDAWTAEVLARVPESQRGAVADAFTAAAGQEGLAALTGTLDGQYALANVYAQAGPEAQATLQAVERGMGVCPALDFAGIYQTPVAGTADADRQALTLDLAQIGLALAGIVDPTPISDGVDGVISLFRGDWLGAGISVVSMVPYLGDLAKVGKLGRFAEAVTRAVDIARTDPGFAQQLRPILEGIRDAINAIPLDSLPSAVREPLERMKAKIDEFFSSASGRFPAFSDGARHVDPVTGKTVIDAAPGAPGSWNSSINRSLEADVIYRTDNGYLYHTDAQGRVSRVESDLVASVAPRNTYQQGVAGGADRLPDDQGGHLIASIFAGPGERINLVAMDGNLNQGVWRQMEASWQSALDSGRQVQVRVEPVYSSDSLRPSRFDVTYQISGEAPVTRTFQNAPGGQ